MASSREVVPFPAKVNGEAKLLVRNGEDKAAYLLENPDVSPEEVCLCALALFRDQDYVDYLAVSVPEEDGGEHWTLGFEMYELIDWMAGLVIRRGSERERTFFHTQRELGSFALKYGFRPDLVVEDRPSESEFDSYVAWVSRELDGEIDVEGLMDEGLMED